MRITRRIEFCASHVCAVPGLSAEENRRLYGRASNPYGHGHNYVLEVSIDGQPDPVTGMIVDLKEVKEILTREIMSVYDHRHLNCEVKPFDQVVPTAENIAVDIWHRLAAQFNGPRGQLAQVRLYETDDFYVEYDGR
jgi:6-pyruvoyltetrahydropterin/6-carboxytetrahydropterin synthase